ncbi:hypothetical protein RHGRI_022034 [Rhododendron griersonianum]|uniref:50S ribosomal protein L31 n=1 Tax=Rhododendron griersonianum TaxID=479676 RepID=A0AAV6JP38_9ERIC|nr:hypothetical protein RHGRI_022034 [Rhododendron griersonianum]
MALSLSSSTSLRRPTFFLQPPPQPSTRKLHRQPQRINCIKREGDSIHPKFYEDAKVFCNGEHVLTVGGTQPEYVIDVWSGNHPFYLGSRSQTLVDDDQVSKFRKKYGELTAWMEIPVLKGEIVIPPKRKSKGSKKK